MGDPLLQVLAGCWQRPTVESRHPTRIVGEDRERGIVRPVRQAQQEVRECPGPGELHPDRRKPPQAIQDWTQARRLPDLLTYRVGLAVGVLHLGGGEPLGHLEGRTEGNVQCHGVLHPRWRLWQGRQEVDPRGEVADGFPMGRAVAGVVTRLLPVVHRLRSTARGGIVLGDQLRLGLHERGEPRFYDLRNLLMDLLAGPLEQRSIGGVLDQGMLEPIPRPRRPSALVEEFGGDQLRQPRL